MNCLILIPTPGEREKLHLPDADHLRIELCGFGLVAAAANASRFIAQYQPERVILCGIAGALSDRISIGSAYQFKRVGLFGVGVGYGDNYISAEQLGWTPCNHNGIDVASELRLELATRIGESCTRDLLISCCAASANVADAQSVKSRFPAAIAEEMEGFGVAVAARLASIPCHIIRGISNVAGNRDHTQWRIDEAMQNVSQLVHVLTVSSA